MTRISYLNGEFLPHEKCFVHIEDRGFQFADAVYEVTLFENNKLIDGDNHAKRMNRSLGELNIKHQFSEEQLIKIQYDLFKHNQMQSGFCYMQISRGATDRQPSCPKGLNPTITATVSKRKIITDQEFCHGFSAMTTPDIRWKRCDIKTVGLLASTLTNQKAKDLGFDDAIFIRDSIVTEATYANVFIVDQNNNLITHPVSNHILCGITRNRIIEIAKANKISVIEKEFSVSELYEAKEIFLTSSTLLIRPIFKIDDKIIAKNDGSQFLISKMLQKKYQEFIDNKIL